MTQNSETTNDTEKTGAFFEREKFSTYFGKWLFDDIVKSGTFSIMQQIADCDVVKIDDLYLFFASKKEDPEAKKVSVMVPLSNGLTVNEDNINTIVLACNQYKTLKSIRLYEDLIDLLGAENDVLEKVAAYVGVDIPHEDTRQIQSFMRRSFPIVATVFAELKYLHPMLKNSDKNFSVDLPWKYTEKFYNSVVSIALKRASIDPDLANKGLVHIKEDQDLSQAVSEIMRAYTAHIESEIVPELERELSIAPTREWCKRDLDGRPSAFSNRSTKLVLH